MGRSLLGDPLNHPNPVDLVDHGVHHCLSDLSALWVHQGLPNLWGQQIHPIPSVLDPLDSHQYLTARRAQLLQLDRSALLAQLAQQLLLRQWARMDQSDLWALPVRLGRSAQWALLVQGGQFHPLVLRAPWC